MTDHPHWGLIDVYAATIPTYRHAPQLHVNYAETVLHMKDGLAQDEGRAEGNGRFG